MSSDELDHIIDSPTVTKARRTSPTTAIVWAEIANGPAPNAVEVAADHGITTTEIKRTGTHACYQVEL